LSQQLAIGSEYPNGYLVLDLPSETAFRLGAAKPTTLDLTNSIDGRLNQAAEPFGRTRPRDPAHRPARELVVAPAPLSAMSKIEYVGAGGGR
jgi:hypothetical protein